MSINENKAKFFLKQSRDKVARLLETSEGLKDHCNYEGIRQNLKFLANETFGVTSAEVHFFGSRIIGLATRKSDLDIFVDFGGNFNVPYRRSILNEERFNKLAAAMKNDYAWRVRELVPKTAVPIICTTYQPLQLECKLINKICRDH